MSRGTRPHLAALDGLRGVAVLAVVAFHLAPLDGGDRTGVLPGGWLGVDAFFTLSGFLITSLLLAEVAGTGRIDLRSFWRRRVRRLQPAALVTIVVTAAAAGWWSAAGSGTSLRNEALAALAGVANWQALVAERAYAVGADPSPFEHFWSLAVEEQFYVVWPVLVAALALAGVGRRAVLALAVGGTALSWATLAGASLSRGYLGTDTRMGSLLVGAALAALLPLGTARRHRSGGLLAGAGLAVVALLWSVEGWPPTGALGMVLPVHALATAGVLAGVVLAPASRPSRLLGVRPLVALGRVSYGVYLWHWPVFVVCTPARLGTGFAGTTAVRLVLVGGLTWCSWRLVEHPIRLDLALRRTRLALPAAVAVAVVVAVGAGQAAAPAPSWASADGRLIAATVAPSVAPSVPPIDTASPDRGAAHVPTRPTRVLVVGDSIPTSLLLADASRGVTWQVGVGRLLDQLAEVGIEAWGATITGCPVIDAVIAIDGEPWPGCQELVRDALARGMADAAPDLVLWYARQDAHPVVLPDGRLDHDTGNLESRIRARVDWFTSRGAKVAFVSPGPNRDGHDAFAPLGSSRRSMADLEKVHRRVAATHPGVVGVMAMRELLCEGSARACSDLRPDGGLFRADDGVHFNSEGAVLAGRWLVDRVAALDLNPPAAAADPAPTAPGGDPSARRGWRDAAPRAGRTG